MIHSAVDFSSFEVSKIAVLFTELSDSEGVGELSV